MHLSWLYFIYNTKYGSLRFLKNRFSWLLKPNLYYFIRLYFTFSHTTYMAKLILYPIPIGYNIIFCYFVVLCFRSLCCPCFYIGISLSILISSGVPYQPCFNYMYNVQLFMYISCSLSYSHTVVEQIFKNLYNAVLVHFFPWRGLKRECRMISTIKKTIDKT